MVRLTKDEDLSAVPAQAGKTKEQLINELVELRRRITESETSETERKRALLNRELVNDTYVQNHFLNPH